MKKINVPLVQQSQGSSDCGPACLAMILKYYDLHFDFDKIKKELGVYSWGTTTPQLGIYLLKQGFQVEIITMHPSLFSLHIKFNKVDDIKKHLIGLKDKMKGKYDPDALKHFLDFIELGGLLTPKVPTLEDVEEEIQKQRPLIVPVTHWFLHESDMPPKFSIHFNVVTGINKKFVAVNDPDWGGDFGGQHEIGRDAFLYAMYCSAQGGIDDACIMKIRKG